MLPTHRVTPIRAERHPHRAAAPALPRDATGPWEPRTHRVRSRVWDTAAMDRPSYGAGKKKQNKTGKQKATQTKIPTHTLKKMLLHGFTPGSQREGWKIGFRDAQIPSRGVVWGWMLVQAHS